MAQWYHQQTLPWVGARGGDAGPANPSCGAERGDRAVFHTRNGCECPQPPAERELSLPARSQPTSVLGTSRWGFDQPSPGGAWAPPGPGRRIQPGVTDLAKVSGVFCVLCRLPRAAVFYWGLWLPPSHSLPPSAPRALSCQGALRFLPAAGGPARLYTCQDLAKEPLEKKP